MTKNTRYKPFYKQFVRLRKNIQDRPRLFKFRKQKWRKFQQYSKNQLKFFKRFKIKDQFQLSVSKFTSRGNSFQKTFRNNLHQRKIFSLFYGGLKKKYLKKHISRSISTKKSVLTSSDFRHSILKVFESRLDTVLHRANFSLSIKGARQFILHGHVSVNEEIVRTGSYLLQNNDLIEITSNIKARDLVKKNLDRSNFWPIPPKHLILNYRTLQVLFVYPENFCLMPVFNHYLNIDSVIKSIKLF